VGAVANVVWPGLLALVGDLLMNSRGFTPGSSPSRLRREDTSRFAAFLPGLSHATPLHR
jgi:hypothetical protein